MNAIATQLENLIDEYFVQLNSIPANDLTFKPSPEKWSKKKLSGI